MLVGEHRGWVNQEFFTYYVFSTFWVGKSKDLKGKGRSKDLPFVLWVYGRELDGLLIAR